MSQSFEQHFAQGEEKKKKKNLLNKL